MGYDYTMIGKISMFIEYECVLNMNNIQKCESIQIDSNLSKKRINITMTTVTEITTTGGQRLWQYKHYTGKSDVIFYTYYQPFLFYIGTVMGLYYII